MQILLSDRVSRLVPFYLMLMSFFMYGVPQGSILGSIPFSLYTTSLSKAIQSHPGIGFHFYADNMQLYDHPTCKDMAQALYRLKFR